MCVCLCTATRCSGERTERTCQQYQTNSQRTCGSHGASNGNYPPHNTNTTHIKHLHIIYYNYKIIIIKYTQIRSLCPKNKFLNCMYILLHSNSSFMQHFGANSILFCGFVRLKGFNLSGERLLIFELNTQTHTPLPSRGRVI